MSSSAAAGHPGDQTVSALQEALAAEQAASYGYGVVGAHLSGSPLAAATADWVAHQRARDQLEQMIFSHGATPRAAAAAYRLPLMVRTGGEAVALAVILEDRVAAAYLTVVALRDPALREMGALRMRAAALRAARWRGSTVAFPGLPGKAVAG